MGQRWFDGYSADIEIYLLINGKRYDVAQIGSGSLIFREPTSLPPSTQAKLVIRIDGHEEIEHVLLMDGATEELNAVSFF